MGKNNGKHKNDSEKQAYIERVKKSERVNESQIDRDSEKEGWRRKK